MQDEHEVRSTPAFYFIIQYYFVGGKIATALDLHRELAAKLVEMVKGYAGGTERHQPILVHNHQGLAHELALQQDRFDAVQLHAKPAHFGLPVLGQAAQNLKYWRRCRIGRIGHLHEEKAGSSI